ncbi:hypothetical protein B0G81_5951 [Paraburkholderia sp. BL6665CI2N2]|nr:hypothetical protein B0G81_5951 [Paraburkholderia sp. BL6665CI2N2]
MCRALKFPYTPRFQRIDWNGSYDSWKTFSLLPPMLDVDLDSATDLCLLEVATFGRRKVAASYDVALYSVFLSVLGGWLYEKSYNHLIAG